MSEYLYSILGNVTVQDVNISKLHTEIQNGLILSVAEFRGVVTKDDDLYVLFTQAIETTEKADLDTIVLNHNNTPVPAKTRHLSFYPDPKEISETYYTTTGCFIYPGNTALTTITAIEVISMMSPGATSYDIQILNRGNNTIIAEQNYTNTTLTLNKLNTINTENIPTGLSAIEVLTRINKQGVANKVVHIDQVVIWLD